MQIERIDEIVKVRADFAAGGEITPILFKHNGRTYRITAVHARWLDRSGAEPVRFFSVGVGPDVYELSFRAVDGVWRLEQAVVEG